MTSSFEPLTEQKRMQERAPGRTVRTTMRGVEGAPVAKSTDLPPEK
jgi:hypothetical protein